MYLIVDDHFGKTKSVLLRQGRGLSPSPKILTKVIRINSFGGKIFWNAQYLLSTWNDLKFLLAILLVIMCTTHKEWGVPFNALYSICWTVQQFINCTADKIRGDIWQAYASWLSKIVVFSKIVLFMKKTIFDLNLL